jgi:hypothetical protein
MGRKMIVSIPLEEDGHWTVIVLDAQDVARDVVEAIVDIDDIVVVDNNCVVSVFCRRRTSTTDDKPDQQHRSQDGS